MILSNIRQRTGDLKYGRQEIASLAVQALAEVVNPKILDLGASRGEDLSNIQELYGKECDLFGVECMAESVRHLNKLGIEAAPVDLESEELPYASATFDLVVSNQTYEHLKNIF